MGNFTIIHNKSGAAVSFYATDYDRQFSKYRFWVGNDKVAEIPEEGYSIIQQVSECAYKAAQPRLTEQQKEALQKARDKAKEAKESKEVRFTISGDDIAGMMERHQKLTNQ